MGGINGRIQSRGGSKVGEGRKKGRVESRGGS